ncbi:hypothetical protein CIPAW_01G154400 [Carya illinoinensis]|uniref:BRX domain-containing protein n=1 Tax=Carya illinoinensis TaxID=32201 RepID=A0A8T1RN08_CARIL|nr:hypothetical protein CIPAW_01G154400 [Carya illinoinensis]
MLSSTMRNEEKEVIEQVEPGVYVTVILLPDGTRVRFKYLIIQEYSGVLTDGMLRVVLAEGSSRRFKLQHAKILEVQRPAFQQED